MPALQQPREQLQLSACPDCGRTDAAARDRRQLSHFWDEEPRERFLMAHVQRCKCGCDFARGMCIREAAIDDDLL